MRESAALADPASPVWDPVDAGRAEPSAAAVTEVPVPAETAAAAPGGVAQASYAGHPDVPARAGGWLTGRGAGDMKGGFAMGLLAVAALRQAAPAVLEAGELSFLSVIEEEFRPSCAP